MYDPNEPRRRQPGVTFDDVVDALTRDPDAVFVVGSPKARAVVISPERWAEIRAALNGGA